MGISSGRRVLACSWSSSIGSGLDGCGSQPPCLERGTAARAALPSSRRSAALGWRGRARTGSGRHRAPTSTRAPAASGRRGAAREFQQPSASSRAGGRLSPVGRPEMRSEPTLEARQGHRASEPVDLRPVADQDQQGDALHADRRAIAGASSMLSLTTFRRPACYCPGAPPGETIRHGPHHGAQKSTSTGIEAATS